MVTFAYAYRDKVVELAYDRVIARMDPPPFGGDRVPQPTINDRIPEPNG
jgi:hypothetical protein